MKGLIPFGFPRVPGYDVAGIVVDTDSGSSFAVGDRVMAFLDHTRGGALADYAVCAVSAMAKISIQCRCRCRSDSTSWDHGPSVTSRSRENQEWTIRSHQLASGGVGMFAVQIAKSYGCHVDAIASERNREFCLSLGADHFYNYEKDDFTKSEERWDIIFDVAGKAH